MSIESNLKKEGIKVVEELDIIQVDSIAHAIAQRLCFAFEEYNFDFRKLQSSLASIKMYIADMPKGFSGAKYFYKNSSIYFNSSIDFSKFSDLALHECIHYLQEVKDKKGFLIRLGLCDFSGIKVRGMALNEAAVQLITARALETEEETVKYFDITLPTTSPSYYTLECNLVNQMAYITGEYSLFHGTLYSTDEFKDKFISLTSEKAYNTILEYLDSLMYAEDTLIGLNVKLAETNDDTTSEKLNKKIADQRKKISDIYIKTQNYILSSYFDDYFKYLETEEDIENYRRKLYNYKDIIGITDDYDFYNSYYIEKMTNLEKKYNLLESGESPKLLNEKNVTNSLIVVKNNKFTSFFKKLKNLLYRSGNEYEKN